jgi:hypothetical protein
MRGLVDQFIIMNCEGLLKHRTANVKNLPQDYFVHQ